MGHLTLELILWLLLAFFIGCTLGCLFRKMFGSASSATETTDTATALKAEPEAEKATDSKTKTKTKPEEKTAAATGIAKRPKGLAAARGGKADKLTRISGVGVKLEKTLHSLGYFHFEQIAAWTPDEVQWVDEHLRFKGRIERDEWLAQASLIADGKEEEFIKLYGSSTQTKKK